MRVHPETPEVLSGYRMLVIDAERGFAICWNGGHGFDAVALSTGSALAHWNLEGEDELADRLTVDEALAEMEEDAGKLRLARIG